MKGFISVIDAEAFDIDFKLRHDDLYKQIQYELKKHLDLDLKKLKFHSIKIMNNTLCIFYTRYRQNEV